MSADEIVALLTAALLVVTGAMIWASLRGVRAQLWVAAFTEYTKRYDDIMSSLPYVARRSGSAFELGALPAAEKEAVLATAWRLLNLYSEEFLLHEGRRIDHSTWRLWERGIRQSAALPCLRSAWGELRNEYDFFPDFRDFMDSTTRADRAARERTRSQDT